jgi:hypothetical protein
MSQQCQSCLDAFTDTSRKFVVYDKGVELEVGECCVGWYDRPWNQAIEITSVDVQVRIEEQRIAENQ